MDPPDMPSFEMDKGTEDQNLADLDGKNASDAGSCSETSTGEIMMTIAVHSPQPLSSFIIGNWAPNSGQIK